MNHRQSVLFVPLLVVGILAILGIQASHASWKAGVAATAITPRQPMPMAGYASRGANHALGKKTDLYAKAIVLEDGTGWQACLITLDVVGIDRQHSQSICEKLMKAHNWHRSQIAICTSHTHSGPVMYRNLRPMHYMMFDETDRKLVDDYATFAEEQIIKTVQQACDKLSPAVLKHGSGRATFAVNRRNNREADVPMLREQGLLAGPIDHDVPVLAVEQNGDLTAVVFGYACHCTVLGEMEWNADYAGYAQTKLEQKHPGAIAMFWAGCGGDQNPLPRRTVELAENYGQQLASAVDEVLQGELSAVDDSLSTKYAEIDLAFGKLPTREDLQKDTSSDNKYIKVRAESLLKDLEEGRPLMQDYPYPIEAWKLGKDIVFLFLGGEVVVDYAIRLKEELANDTREPTEVWCAGYSNDVLAYIPSLRVLREGGYEGGGAMVYYGLPTIWSESVEESIISATKKLVND